MNLENTMNLHVSHAGDRISPFAFDSSKHSPFIVLTHSSETEVCNLRFQFSIQQNVIGFDIAMSQTFGTSRMKKCQSLRQSKSNIVPKRPLQHQCPPRICTQTIHRCKDKGRYRDYDNNRWFNTKWSTSKWANSSRFYVNTGKGEYETQKTVAERIDVTPKSADWNIWLFTVCKVRVSGFWDSPNKAWARDFFSTYS